MNNSKLLQPNCIPVPVEIATKLREHLKTRASDGAMFLQQLHYWTLKDCGRVIDGVKWIWNTYAGWLKNFEWWTEWDFRVITKKLKELDLIKFCQPNDYERDRTGHYRLNYDHKWLKNLQVEDSSDSSDASASQPPDASGEQSSDTQKSTPSTASEKKAEVEKSFPQAEEEEEEPELEPEEIIEKYHKELKFRCCYPLVWENDVLIKNSKFYPIIRALKKVSAAEGEQAIKAFLKWIPKTTEDYIEQRYKTRYKALESAIVNRWVNRD